MTDALEHRPLSLLYGVLLSALMPLDALGVRETGAPGDERDDVEPGEDGKP